MSKVSSPDLSSPDPSWDPIWIQDPAADLSMRAFRMVETQYVAATMRLVDSSDEQDLLERMLEASKPELPPEAHGLHYLLAAPFRYRPQTESRFRSVNLPGVWYGADDPYCACAEIAYWRQRFLLDSVGLMKQHLSTAHSLYQATVNGRAVDLLSPPWSQAQALWQHHSHYIETQKLGKLVRDSTDVKWIRYGSVRATGHVCAAVFDPRSLTMVSADGQFESWHCHTTRDKVTFSNGRERFDF
jgi:RES domain